VTQVRVLNARVALGDAEPIGAGVRAVGGRLSFLSRRLFFLLLPPCRGGHVQNRRGEMSAQPAVTVRCDRYDDYDAVYQGDKQRWCGRRDRGRR
jgi:hypothetical protein